MSTSSEESSSSINSFVVESPPLSKSAKLKKIFSHRQAIWIYHPMVYMLSNLIGFLISVSASSKETNPRIWVGIDTGIAFIICGIWSYLHFDRQYQKQSDNNVKYISNNKVRYTLYTLLAIIPIAWTIIWRIYGFYIFIASEFDGINAFSVYSVIAFLHPILMIISTAIIWLSLKFCCPLEPNMTVLI